MQGEYENVETGECTSSSESGYQLAKWIYALDRLCPSEQDVYMAANPEPSSSSSRRVLATSYSSTYG